MAGILSVQIKSVMGDIEQNLRKIEFFIKKHSDKNLDLVLVPEFFATHIDYIKNAMPSDGGRVIEFMCDLAKKYNTNIVAGSVVRKKDTEFYNTSFAINRLGEVVANYDKIHLFNYMGGSEGREITAGDKIVTVDFDFGKVGLAICFDVRYPLHFNKLAKENVDLITLPTAWLVPSEIYNTPELLKNACDMWMAMCRTRAYDNGVYLVVSNQTKDGDKNFVGIGHSMIISPTAQIIANAFDKECGIYTDIDIEAARYMKQMFPIEVVE